MKIACLMMQKNELALLDTWIRYHGSLFGYENLFIFDNGSEIEEINSILHKHIRRGISLQKAFRGKKDFFNKGHILGEYIKFLDQTADYDFFVPLDCDEFLAVQSEEDEILCQKGPIVDEFLKYENTVQALQIKGSYFNIPRDKEKFYFYPEQKLLFRSKTFAFMDEGFHVGRTVFSNTPILTNFVHLHYANKPFELGKSHAQEKLVGLVDNFSKENMLSYNGPGEHLKRFFVQTKEQYESAYFGTEVAIPAFKSRLSSIGLKLPFSVD
jgi:hypothetical protein